MTFMKHPCKRCPFRNDVKPYLHPERAAELAYAAQNPYSSFACHKTTEYDEETGDMEVTERSKECAGFLTLRAQAGEDVPEGFEPSWEMCYTDEWDMIDAYEQEWSKTRLHNSLNQKKDEKKTNSINSRMDSCIRVTLC